MRAYLMFSENDPCNQPECCFERDDLQADLEIKRVLENMAKDDEVVYEICRDTIFSPLQSAAAVKYRQEILKDTLGNPDIVRRIYSVTAEAERVRKRYAVSAYRDDAFKSTVELLKTYTKLLRDLQEASNQTLQFFKSEGFRKMIDMLGRELTDTYFSEVNDNLHEISNVDNMLVSAKLGSHLQSVDYTLRRKEKNFWFRWLSATSFTADEHSPEQLADISSRHERAISEASNVLKWSATYLEDFFKMLRSELAFYIGCLNLSDKLRELGMPMCFPELLPMEGGKRVWKGLYDVSLALMKDAAVVGNELDASGKILYIITGANQGGKSTFLRSVGQAQLMAQSGMFVGAENASIPLRSGVFTHFKREEDNYMLSGRLDEELSRMSKILDQLKPGSMVLLNESFSSTNEREGSEICGQVTKAMVENDVEVFSVTHLYMYAASFQEDAGTLFLRAQRREDAVRTFKILPGDPLETAFGEDLYQKIFVQSGKTLG